MQSHLYRVRKDHYRGMSEAERAAIHATQLAQVEEKRAREAAAAAEDAAYARTQAGILRAMDAQVCACVCVVVVVGVGENLMSGKGFCRGKKSK
jgi:hypothetical protein